jgi:hypothetical protein
LGDHAELLRRVVEATDAMHDLESFGGLKRSAMELGVVDILTALDAESWTSAVLMDWEWV